ncbi:MULTISPECIES: beta-propeller fold lactonase family protein [unclassified Variovorax]|uniref:lactonase family protein n=1 Tax=unclassified Variovorax TaxID=663243 RepID=UPI001BD31549|nr:MULTISPECIES: beta-propeller fold lactonase family protein [unclassified Variovorax]
MFAVYVSNAESGDISVLQLDPALRTLTPVQTVEVGGEVMPLALSPKRDRLYAARRSEPREAVCFAIDAKSGALSLLGAGPLPQSMAYIATDLTGRYLFSASYGGNLIAVNAIDGNGVVQATQQVVPTGPNAHAILATPSNRFVFSTSLGGKVVNQFRFDAATGQLVPNTPPSITPHEGASPRHFVFSPDARFVYLLNELDASIDVLVCDAASGTLNPVQNIGSLPPGFSGEPWAADLHLTPDGRYLYSSERRSDTLAAFRVDAADGTLSLIGHTPTESQPRGFNITADGQFLIAAGQKSDRLRLYGIDSASGELTPVGDAPAGRGANWVESISLTA